MPVKEGDFLIDPPRSIAMCSDENKSKPYHPEA
jgi:hypothetical protein